MEPSLEEVKKKADKHMKTIKVPKGYEQPTRDLVEKMIAHPAFNNENYTWSLDDFELGNKLGRGKFGRVYLAREKRTNYLVAIKTLMKKEIHESHVHKQVLREIEIQSRLKHNNVLELLAFFHDSHRIYLVLEYAGRGELYKHLKNAKNGRFDEDRSAKYISHVARALQYCHEHNVIHRDLKPENLLLTITDDVKLADFGWSVHTPSNTRHTMCGTLDYLPPEMVSGKDYRHTVDNWCLGILCYEFLHGYPPFESDTSEKTYKRIATLDIKYGDHISAAARDLIMKLVVIKAEERMSLKQVLRHRWITYRGS